jgi:hypothetical protein
MKNKIHEYNKQVKVKIIGLSSALSDAMDKVPCNPAAYNNINSTFLY